MAGCPLGAATQHDKIGLFLQSPGWNHKWVPLCFSGPLLASVHRNTKAYGRHIHLSLPVSFSSAKELQWEQIN